MKTNNFFILMQIKLFILFIFLFNNTNAQTWNYVGKAAGKDIKFTLKIIIDEKNKNFFYIGGSITKLDKGYLYIAYKDIIIPKNVKIITKTGSIYKQWSYRSNPILHNQRLKFELLPGFKGGNIDLRIRCQYNSESNGFKLNRLSKNNGRHTFKIKNLPKILTAYEIKAEYEKNGKSRLVEKAKDIEMKYRDTINMLKSRLNEVSKDSDINKNTKNNNLLYVIIGILLILMTLALFNLYFKK